VAIRHFVFGKGYEDPVDPEPESEDDAASDTGNDESNVVPNNTINAYPIITSLGIDLDELNSNRVKLLIGELVRLQRSSMVSAL
jgi:hypothetical protein